MRNVVLFGFMGTGKTVVGREVSRKLRMQFTDMDDVIEEREGCAIAEIFATKGEQHFRSVESAVAEDLSSKEGLVIATGGGVVLNRRNVDSFQRSGTGICLTASPEVIYQRVKDESHRPLLTTDDPLQRIRSLLEYRAPFYATVEYQIDTSALPVNGAVDRILSVVHEDRKRRAGTRCQREDSLQ